MQVGHSRLVGWMHKWITDRHNHRSWRPRWRRDVLVLMSMLAVAWLQSWGKRLSSCLKCCTGCLCGQPARPRWLARTDCGLPLHQKRLSDTWRLQIFLGVELCFKIKRRNLQKSCHLSGASNSQETQDGQQRCWLRQHKIQMHRNNQVHSGVATSSWSVAAVKRASK